MKIDLSEIKDGHTWEQFAAAFLGACGFRIEGGPGMGSDNGVDFFASINVPNSNVIYKFLVSCKMRSAPSIGSGDDNINGEMRARHGADGFLFFYNKPPSSGLLQRINGSASAGQFHCEIWDNSRILGELLKNPNLHFLMQQFFPSTWAQLQEITQGKKCGCGIGAINLMLVPYQMPGSSITDTTLACGLCWHYIEGELQRVGAKIGRYTQLTFDE